MTVLGVRDVNVALVDDIPNSETRAGYALRGIHREILSALIRASCLISCRRRRRRRKKRKASKRKRRLAAPNPAAIPAIIPVLLLLNVELGVFATEGPSTVVSAGFSVHETFGMRIEVRFPVSVIELVAEPVLGEET